MAAGILGIHVSCLALLASIPCSLSSHIATSEVIRAEAVIDADAKFQKSKDVSGHGELVTSQAADNRDKTAQDRPLHGQRAVEALEAVREYEKPQKHESWSLRFPKFIEKHPIFYASAFVFLGVLVMFGVCLYVYMEDMRAEEARQQRDLILARRQVNMAAVYSKQRAAAFTTASAQVGSEEEATAGFRIPKSEASARRSAAPVGGESAAKFAAPIGEGERAAARGMNIISSAVKGLTGMLAGEGGAMSKLGGRSPQGTTSASGNTTPRSEGATSETVSSRRSDAGASETRSDMAPSETSNSMRSDASSTARPPAISMIRDGTKLVAKIPEVIFASSTSWRKIGELAEGQEVTAAGPPDMVDDFTMVPIKPKGAVDLKVLQVVRGSEWQ